MISVLELIFIQGLTTEELLSINPFSSSTVDPSAPISTFIMVRLTSIAFQLGQLNRWNYPAVRVPLCMVRKPLEEWSILLQNKVKRLPDSILECNMALMNS